MIAAAGAAPPPNSNTQKTSTLPSPQENTPENGSPAGSSDTISKIARIAIRAAAVYPSAAMAAQIKGGGSYSEAVKHMMKKVRTFHYPRSGSGAYIAASTASLMPATLVDPIKRHLMERGVEPVLAQKLALGFSALATGVTTNFRNFAFTGGKHGLDGKKIFHPLPIASSLVRDTLTGLVYAKALQAQPEQTRFERVQRAVSAGIPTGVFTSVFDVMAYMAAKEKISFQVLLQRTVRTAPVRAFNVAWGAAIMAGLAPQKAPPVTKKPEIVDIPKR